MIKTTTVGICDRCSIECHQKINRLELQDIPIKTIQSANRFLSYTGGIQLNMESEGFHLCGNCLGEFKIDFMRARL